MVSLCHTDSDTCESHSCKARAWAPIPLPPGPGSRFHRPSLPHKRWASVTQPLPRSRCISSHRGARSDLVHGSGRAEPPLKLRPRLLSVPWGGTGTGSGAQKGSGLLGGAAWRGMRRGNVEAEDRPLPASRFCPARSGPRARGPQARGKFLCKSRPYRPPRFC